MIARWVLLFVLCLVIPAAFAADVKISALPAASSATLSDQLPANQSGTTNKVTLQQVRDLFVATISGSNGTAGSFETHQVLIASCSNASVTLATCMTTNGLTAGTWLFEYHLIWQSGNAARGINFAVITSGPTTTFVATRQFNDQGTSAVAGTADQVVAATSGAIMGFMATRTNGGNLGPNAAVDTIDADIYDVIRGVAVTTAPGRLDLQSASEVAGTTAIREHSLLILRKMRE